MFLYVFLFQLREMALFFFFPDCKNTISEADCQLRMMRGECADNPVFMSLNCKYTCGFCSKKNSFILISSNVPSFLRLSLINVYSFIRMGSFDNKIVSFVKILNYKY